MKAIKWALMGGVSGMAAATLNLLDRIGDSALTAPVTITTICGLIAAWIVTLSGEVGA
jgi:hypothetical protein